MEGYPGCHEYETTAEINGQPSPAWGTACLQPDGTWQVIN
jgi:surface antigen